jgi:hypothetical protein
MNKYLIEVKLPAAGLVYDLLVPDTMQIGTLTALAASALSRLSGGIYIPSGSSVLCCQKTGAQYDVNARVYETDIRNGSKLFLY